MYKDQTWKYNPKTQENQKHKKTSHKRYALLIFTSFYIFKQTAA